MARHDLEPDERDLASVTVEQIVECPFCHIEFDVVFAAPPDVTETQDLIEAPTSKVQCPGCGMESVHRYDGWTTFDDAG